VPIARGDTATLLKKLAVNYLAFVELASIRLWLRVAVARANDSAPEMKCRVAAA